MEIWVQILANGLLTGGIFALISIGLTLVFGVMNIINFAHGDFLMLSMYLVYWMNVKMGMDPYVAIILLIPIMFVLGLFVYKATLNPIIERSELFTILSTVAIMIFLQNIALMLWNADVRCVDISYAASAIGTESLRFGVTKVASFAIAIATALGLMVILNRTWIGKSIKATSQNRTAAKLMGVDTIKTYTIAFAIGIATVGVAGGALAPIYSIFPTVGTQFGTTAFVVVVLGGLGNIPGALIGGLIIGLIDSISGFLLPVGFKEAIYFGVFLLVLLFSRMGYLGKVLEVDMNVSEILDNKAKLFLAILAIIVFLALIIPAAQGNAFIQNIFILMLIFAGIASAWNIIGGYAGQLSLGHAGFFGIGAYTVVLLSVKLSVSPWIGLIVAIIFAIIAAIIIGWPCFRLQGPFFALATIAVGEVLRIMAVNFPNLTYGTVGISVKMQFGLAYMLFREKWAYAI